MMKAGMYTTDRFNLHVKIFRRVVGYQAGVLFYLSLVVIVVIVGNVESNAVCGPGIEALNFCALRITACDGSTA